MIGIGIGQYKPSGLRDWEKVLVGIAGLKNATGDPLTTALSLKDWVCSSPLWPMMATFTNQLLFTRSANNLATKRRKEKSYMNEKSIRKFRVMRCNLLKCWYTYHYKKLKRATKCKALSFFAQLQVTTCIDHDSFFFFQIVCAGLLKCISFKCLC